MARSRSEKYRGSPRWSGVGHRLDDTATLQADRLAVQDDSVRWTYAELVHRAEALTNRLRDVGVGPGQLVGVCLPRGANLVAAILGVNRSGAAYLPLDANHPAERRSRILADAQVRWLIADEGDSALPPEQVQILRMPTVSAPNLEPPTRVAPEDPAYVIYTSGSTGGPKGVIVTQHNLARLFESTAAWFAFGHEDAWTLFHSIAFDFSVWEMWGALIHGGRLIIPSAEIVRSPTEFHDLVLRERVTVLNQTPTAFRSFLSAHQRAGMPETSLRIVLFGGEALNLSTLVPWFERHGDECPHVVNMYGITEITVHATYRRLRLADCAPAAPSLIGTPLPDLAIDLRDTEGRPVADGEPGEIYVTGPGVAAGYLRRPEITARHFVTTAGHHGEVSRTYRSGDLAYRLPTGELAFVGRADEQLKVRGFRIEPREIEQALLGVPGIQDAVVLAHEGDRLVAWFVAPSERCPSPDRLRELMKPLLPDYMLPAAFVRVDALPRTANDKLDKGALPAPSEESYPRPSERRRAKSELEQAVVSIVEAVLHLHELSPDDDIVRLGGTSIDVARIVIRCERELGVLVPMGAVFRMATIGALAAAVAAGTPGSPPDCAPGPISTSSTDSPAPLSFGQQRLWFVDAFGDDLGPPPIVACLRLRGRLDEEALQSSLDGIVNRHEVLRSVIENVEGKLIQRALRPAAVAIERQTAPPADEMECFARAVAQARAFDARPLALSREHPLRVALLRHGDEEHVLVLWLHHIAGDAWSMRVLLDELAQLYAAFCAREPSPLPSSGATYADFARWQRSAEHASAIEAGLTYWRDQLANLPATTEFPIDRKRPEIRSGKGARTVRPLSPDLVERLRRLSGEKDATLFMTLLAALQALLYRHTGQEDIVVGSPIATRSRPEWEHAVGIFLNNLVLRTKLTATQSFEELLANTRETVLGAFEHQEVPFERLVRELGGERRRNQNPIYQILFNVHEDYEVSPRLPGLDVALLDLPDDRAPYDMTIYVIDRQGELSVKIVYDTELFTSEHVAELLEQYALLLEQVARAPETPIEALSLVTPTARRMLADPSRVLRGVPHPSVGHSFRNWASSTPGAIAVTHEGRALTYAQLADCAAAIASELRELQQDGDTVAVAGPRSFGLVAASLGVLQSQCKLLLLDTALPRERRRAMLRASSASALLWIGSAAPEDLDTWCGPPHEIRLRCLDPHLRSFTACTKSAQPEPELPLPSDKSPAYVFFTSGSTGSPKGIVGTHAGLAHFLAWQRTTFDVMPGDRVAQLTALSFDVVLRDLLLPLVSGATVCLPDRGADALATYEAFDWIRRERITLIHAVPSLAETWLRALQGRAMDTHLRIVFFAGEPLLDTLAARWRAVFGRGCRLVNLYGPTETTLAKVWHEVGPEPTYGVQPIGRPLPDAQAFLLTPAGVRCGLGEIGEIAIRTPYASLGYLESHRGPSGFGPNPFADDPDDRIYRTGDLGRFRVDGVLEILGRRDGQVKIRGVRVELSEVEATLCEHPDVHTCAVTVKGEAGTSTSLHAYVVPAAGREILDSELRMHLVRRLPQQVIPSSYRVVDTLPLLPNGKVDRAALPQPAATSTSLSQVAPRDEREARLARIWEDVLGRRPIGIHDDFFALGGHSLLAVELMDRVGHDFACQMPLVALFEAPTVAQLAERIGSGTAAEADSGAVSFNTSGTRPPLFALPGFGGVAAFTYRMLARALGPDQPLHGLQQRGIDGTSAPHRSVEDMAMYHIDCIKQIQPDGPYALVGYSFGGRIALEVARQLRSAGDAVSLLAMIDSSAPGYPRIHSLWKRLRLHSRQLAARGLVEGTAYLVERAKQVCLRGLRLVGRLRPHPVGPAMGFKERKAAYDRVTRAAALRYDPDVYEGDLVLFRSSEKPRWLGASHDDPQNGWGAYIAGNIEVCPLSGGHLEVFVEENLQILTDQLRRRVRH